MTGSGFAGNVRNGASAHRGDGRRFALGWGFLAASSTERARVWRGLTACGAAAGVAGTLTIVGSAGGGFARDPWRASALAVLAGAAAGFETLASAGAAESRVEADDARSVALGFATGLSLLVLWAGPLALRAAGPTPATQAGVGAALMLAGAGLRVAAIRQLGSRFSSTNAIAPGAALERRGLYRWMAHPSELGLFALGAGALLLSGAAIAWWLGFVLLYALTVSRLTLEELALVQHHGDAYRAYRATTLDPIPTFIQSVRGTTT